MGTHSPEELDAAACALLSPVMYADPDRVDRATALLRAHSPIHRAEHPDYRPLWAVTRYADVREVEAHAAEWSQGGHPFLRTREEIRRLRSGAVAHVRMLIDYDGDEHCAYRSVAQKWFTPRALAALDARVRDLACRAVDRMESAGGRCDVAQEVAAPFPLETILSLLGLPESDFAFVLRLSQQLLNSSVDATAVPRTEEEQRDLMQTFSDYFTALTLDRRARPTDDLASAIANADVPGIGEMPMADAIGYYIILSVAGHETTSASMAGGVLALCQFPEQYALLRREIGDERLVANAAEEIVRWVTPVKHFCRTATTGYTLGDHRFERGDVVFLSYSSANRDEIVFVDAHRFDLRRANAKDHLAFGFGAHYCLGSQLARLQIRALLREVATRVTTMSLDGEVRFAPAIATSGLTSLPVSYTFAG